MTPRLNIRRDSVPGARKTGQLRSMNPPAFYDKLAERRLYRRGGSDTVLLYTRSSSVTAAGEKDRIRASSFPSASAK
jgi:hypothetical protein